MSWKGQKLESLSGGSHDEYDLRNENQKLKKKVEELEMTLMKYQFTRKKSTDFKALGVIKSKPYLKEGFGKNRRRSASMVLPSSRAPKKKKPKVRKKKKVPSPRQLSKPTRGRFPMKRQQSEPRMKRFKIDHELTDEEKKFSSMYIEVKEQFEKERGRNTLLQQEVLKMQNKIHLIKRETEKKDTLNQKLLVENFKLKERMESRDITRKETDIKIMTEYLDDERNIVESEKKQAREEIDKYLIENEKMKSTLQKAQFQIKCLELDCKKFQQAKIEMEIMKDEYEFMAQGLRVEVNGLKKKQSEHDAKIAKKKGKIADLKQEMKRNKIIVEQFNDLKKNPEFQHLFQHVSL